jgi:hypothetical protein
MSESVPETHPLRQLFLSALDRAFQERAELYAPGVSTYLGEDVLCDFVHVDNLYRLKDSKGQRLEDLPDMLHVTVEREGPERRMEVDSYIGAFALFMGGFFPSSLHRNRWFVPNPMVSKVGQIFVSFHEPLDYYAAEGRNAYGRAAETARVFAPEARETYSLLAGRFPEYLELIRRVKALLSDDPHLRKVESILD